MGTSYDVPKRVTFLLKKQKGKCNRLSRHLGVKSIKTYKFSAIVSIKLF
jgi:hypothetical protein